MQTVGKMTAEVSRGSPAERRHGQRKIILIGFHKHHLAVAELEGKIVMYSFPSKEQVSFNFMAAVTICSAFGAQENEVYHCFHFFPINLP